MQCCLGEESIVTGRVSCCRRWKDERLAGVDSHKKKMSLLLARGGAGILVATGCPLPFLFPAESWDGLVSLVHASPPFWLLFMVLLCSWKILGIASRVQLPSVHLPEGRIPYSDGHLYFCSYSFL